MPRWVQWNRNGTKLDRPAKVAPVTTQSADKAYALVLARAGCFPRDRVSRRTIAEVKNRTGNWGRNARDELTDDWFLEGLKVGRPPTDTDGDGLPDSWEQTHGLNQADGDDANTVMPSGYTAIEQYLNQLAAELVPANAPQ